MREQERRDFVPQSELVSALRQRGLSEGKIKALLREVPTHVGARPLYKSRPAGPQVLPRVEPAKIRVKGYSEDDAERILVWIVKKTEGPPG